MSSQPPSAEHTPSARSVTNTTSPIQDETIRIQPESADENDHQAQPTQSQSQSQSKTEAAEEGHHITFASATPHDHTIQHVDKASTYYSAKSRFSSLFTRSSGQRSQRGATWLQAITNTINSGFGSGAPRGERYTGVVEGREKGGYVPRLTGVGRTGKALVPVPPSMLRALGVKSATQSDENIATSSTTNGRKMEAHRPKGFYGNSLEDIRLCDGSAVPIVVIQFIEVVELYGQGIQYLYFGGVFGSDKGGDFGSL